MEYTQTHFRLLRLAKLRGLEVRPLGGKEYAVSSHSRPGRWYRMTAGERCPCDAVEYCTHMAAAVNAWAMEYDEAYEAAWELDFALLRLRQLFGQLHRDDKLYSRSCMQAFAPKYAAEPRPERELAGAQF